MFRQQVKCHLVTRVMNPQTGGLEKGVAPVVQYRARLDFDDACELISKRSMLTSADVKSILQSVLTWASYFLMQSKTVRLGDVGYLTSAMRTEQVEDKESYAASHIRGVHPVFVPSTLLKRQLKATSISIHTNK